MLPEETIIYDRTGKIELARFGDAKREVVTFERDPEGPARRDDRGRGQDLLGERRLRPGGDRVGRRSARCAATAAAPRRSPSSSSAARLLDDDLVQDPDRTIERKLKEIIQSIRVTQAFQGEEGKQEIITAYLNQNYYGNQSYGVKAAVRSLLRDRPRGDRPRPRRRSSPALPKSPSNYDLVRNADRALHDGRRGGRGVPEAEARRPRGHDDRRAAQPDPRPARRRPDPDVGRRSTRAADFTAAKDEEVVLASQATPRWIAPHFVWAVRDELADRAVRRGRRRCDALDRGGLRVTTTLDAGLQKIAEKWVRAAAIVPHAKDPAAAAQGARLQEARAVDGEPARARTCTTARSSRSTTRPASWSPTSAARTTTRPRPSRSSSRSTTSSARATASPVRRSSRSTTRSASTTRRSPPARC